MWVAKFQMSRSTSIFEPIAKKYNLTIIGYPITSFIKDKKNYFIATGTFIGSKKDMEKGLKELRKNKKIIKIERKKDFFIVIYKRDLLLKELYNPQFIQVKPIIINGKNKEIWEIGCFEKKTLIKLISFSEKQNINFKLLKLKQEILSSLTFFNTIPDITSKQKKAIELAVENGYYNYPKKIELKELAKLMRVSYSTYHAHLKKAEGKLIPFLSRNF